MLLLQQYVCKMFARIWSLFLCHLPLAGCGQMNTLGKCGEFFLQPVEKYAVLLQPLYNNSFIA